MFAAEELDKGLNHLPEGEHDAFRSILAWGFTQNLDFRASLEGAWVRDGRQTLGLKSGPSYDLDALLHEIGHFIEIDDARVCVSGWGLVYGTVLGEGPTMIQDFQTCQGTKREVRVCVIQSVLREYFGLDPDVSRTLNSLQYVGDYYHIDPTPDVEVPGWGNYHGNRFQRERIATVHSWYAEQRAEARLEPILEEFERKLSLLD